MDWKNPLHRFQFHHQRIPDDEIQPISAIEFHSLVNHGYGNLTIEGNFIDVKLVAETGLVGRFQ
jgi:hypothetical protein